MKFLTQRNAAASGFGLVAVGVGLVLVPGGSSANATVANAAANVAENTSTTTASVAPPVPVASSSAAAPSSAPAKPAPSTPTPSPTGAKSPDPTYSSGPGTFGGPSSTPSSSHAAPTQPPAPHPTTTSKPSPPPVHSSSPAPSPSPHPTSSTIPGTNPGMVINIGDKLAIGVAGSNTADGSQMVVWHPDPNLVDQHWLLNWATVGSTGGIDFESNLTHASVMDLNTANNQVDLWHSLTGTNQLWWFADGPVTDEFYIHNQMTGGCLTDNGLGNLLTVAPCGTGNTAQLWTLT
ncbi:hypothetical protein KGQ20_40280 [Catenulispora sp. NF23]|uniref:RICIN domain-containing protein n=1 Tax=Catenulispora pinistramenti TaxID=2705254 RepID=UPI001BAC3A88|nr:hypothetical protein [Catenulispora pinistramenti]MBS2539004.1 hypothetical protein [Catenulispora pinistramenti]